jgi:DegV family protein with EDD domain
MLRIVTDNASDIRQSEAKKMNLELVFLPITFENSDYSQADYDSFDEFYRLLKQAKKLPSTSQVSPGDYLDIFNDAKEKNDEVLVITLSSGLSGTYNSALNAKEICDYDRITVVDSWQGSASQRILVEAAIKMRDEGKGINDIAAILEDIRKRTTICGVIDTLTYLQKGGRVPPALALVGNILNIKPIVIMRDKKLEMLGKAKGFNNGIKQMYAEFEKGEIDLQYPVYFGHSDNIEKGEIFMRETVTAYKLDNVGLFPVGSVIGTHSGPNCVLMAFVKK